MAQFGKKNACFGLVMIDEKVLILENKRINEKYYKLVFDSSHLAKGVLPGQFLTIQIEEGLDPFLRRPFSYYRVQDSRIEVLYEILGKGTGMLARKQKGESLQVMGLLGKSFSKKVPGKRVLIAGGVGVPPLIFLAEQEKTDFLLIGAKSKQEVMPETELSKVKAKILYATNDGSYGEKGFVTLLLEKLIKQEGAASLFIQTCGPKPMMRAVMDVACREGISGEASIDETMACGVGACLGCMVKTDAGWVPSCTEGPVFPFSRLIEF